MTMIIRTLLAASILAVFSVTVWPQSASKVISQANKALGGEKALKAITSTERIGRIRRLSDGATGSFSSYASGGGLYAGKYDLDGFEMEAGYNGRSGWIRDSLNGLRTVTGDTARDLQAEAAFRSSLWLRAKEERAKLTLAGTESIDGRQANVVSFITAKGAKFRLYFDSSSGLLIREVVPQGATLKTFDYSDHRSVNGIMTPFSIRCKVGDETFEISLDEVRYNVAIARSIFDFPVISNEPLPDIRSLLVEIRRNADRVDEILEGYSYTETRIQREPNAAGELIEKSSEKRLLTFYRGYRINRLVEKNGRPLSPSEQAKEDRDAAKQVEEIESKIAARERREQREMASGAAGQPSDNGQRITIADALKGSRLLNPRRERFRGRDVIVFDYEPDPAFKPQSRMERLFSLCSGAVWVDNSTKQVIRLDAVLMQSAGNFLVKAKRGASFSLENELVNDEIWLPARADVNLSIKILFGGINLKNLIKYGDYRKFETDVKDVKVGEDGRP